MHTVTSLYEKYVPQTLLYHMTIAMADQLSILQQILRYAKNGISETSSMQPFFQSCMLEVLCSLVKGETQWFNR